MELELDLWLNLSICSKCMSNFNSRVERRNQAKAGVLSVMTRVCLPDFEYHFCHHKNYHDRYNLIMGTQLFCLLLITVHSLSESLSDPLSQTADKLAAPNSKRQRNTHPYKRRTDRVHDGLYLPRSDPVLSKLCRK